MISILSKSEEKRMEDPDPVKAVSPAAGAITIWGNMCIAVFIWKAHPIYPFLLLLNRDEFHDRPTSPLAWWEEEQGTQILGGRDGLAGGTWLACATNGRLSFLTNVRELRSTSQYETKSRGDLPVRFLKSEKSPKDFADELTQEADNYNGFNLIVADLSSMAMVYITNRPKGSGITAMQVCPGVHVLSNAKLDTPWPKVCEPSPDLELSCIRLSHFNGMAQRLEQSFKDLLDKYGETEIPLKEISEKLMRDTTKDDESKLPRIYPPAFEYQLSSIFVDCVTPTGRYGTRSSSILAMQAGGNVTFCERHLDDDSWKEQSINFEIEKEKDDIIA